VSTSTAQYIYIDAKEFGGDVRNTGRRARWLEAISKAGKCRKDKASEDNIVKWEKETRTLVPWTPPALRCLNEEAPRPDRDDTSDNNAP
jgi:hypothetical protein